MLTEIINGISKHDFDLELLESHTYHAKYIDTSCMYLSCHNDNVAMIKASTLWCNDKRL